MPSKLLLVCLSALYTSAERNTGPVIAVPGHSHEGNEEADRLAKMGSVNTFYGPGSDLGIPKNYLRKAVNTWTK